MSSTTTHTEKLAAAVEQVPGVDELYPANAVLSTVVHQVVAAITQKPATPEFVGLTETHDGITASVSIGISDAEAASEVCRQVYDAIDHYFAASAEPDEPAVTRIEVTVARIG
ncbi:hypothetical protein K2F54_12755 [Cryobacterium sp. 1639]|uniref:hypothetical protein n=1 Tax=Cryobacterium inferilacus TaxID=2866629 RepID=UPI001C73AA01|nr:hypothetical protein [Cryobacterium sp. 1639]MBX0300845.1 hypothetical protein [Cryobacterium sp. 1639]